MSIMIPALAAANFLGQRQSAEEERRRQMAELGTQDMPSRRATPDYAASMNMTQAPRASAQAMQRAAPQSAVAAGATPPPNTGARQAPGSFNPPATPQRPAMGGMGGGMGMMSQPAPGGGVSQPINPYAASAPSYPAGQAANQAQLAMGVRDQMSRATRPAQPASEERGLSDGASLGLSLAGQALSNQQQDDAIRRAALTNIAGQQARRLNAPSYGIQAASAQRGMRDNAGMNYLQPLLEHYRSRR